ncbi:hypothetical protein [Paraburkholderia sediminicola]|uniref:hypothetical protein n=1 Tax=Paraburkholderia sediminicola TaxID=458836 RepID=UPI0038BC2431
MRTDPRKACANEKQLFGWAVVHDLIAHPLMVLTAYSRLSIAIHDATSLRAWPRDTRPAFDPVWIPSDRFGLLRITETPAGFFEIEHGRIRHRFVVKAADITDAVEQAEEWFESLAELIPHSRRQHVD